MFVSYGAFLDFGRFIRYYKYAIPKGYIFRQIIGLTHHCFDSEGVSYL